MKSLGFVWRTNLCVEELRVEQKKEYTAKEVAEGILARAKELAKDQLQKAEMSVKEAAKEIKGDKKVNEVLPKVAPDKRDDVLKELRMDKADPRNQNSAQMAEVKVPQPKVPEGQPKAIAKQPLQLKKFMERREAKKMAKAEGRCWEGYEPVPGKKPYSEGSCRKK